MDFDKSLKKAKCNLIAGKSPRTGFSLREIDELSKRYSYLTSYRDADGFISDGEHVITSLSTPRPYIHLLSSLHNGVNNQFGSFWDQAGYGFSCLDSVLAGPVTSHKDRSYVPTAPGPLDFRAFYLREKHGKNSVDIWNMNPQAGHDDGAGEDFKTVQGLGFVEISSASHNVESVFKSFVPENDTCEIWTIKLSNSERKKRKLKLFIKLNWDLTVHPGYYFDPRSTSGGDYIESCNALIALQRYKKNALPRTGFMMADRCLDGFDISGESFQGYGYNGLWPQAVAEGKCGNSLGHQPYMGLIGAMEFDVILPANGLWEVNVIVGSTSLDKVKYKKDIKRLQKKYFTVGGVDKAFKRVRSIYAERMQRCCSDSPDHEVDICYNVWLKYQSRNQSRWVRALDQVGYRDVLQDMLGLVQSEPEFVKNNLPVVLNYQLKDGRAIRQFFKYPDTHASNDERMYSDSPLWISDLLVSYVEETGDTSLLDEMVGFYDLKKHQRDESVKKSVYDHCYLGILQAYRTRGQKGLCLVGHGDWNDAIDGLSPKGKGVSVWLSLCLVFAAKRFRKLAVFLKDTRRTKKMDEIILDMSRDINRYGWDKDRYIFGYNDEGVAISSRKSKEGNIYAPSNTWALITGVAQDAGREQIVLNTLAKLNSPLGLHLLDVPYTDKSRSLVGRISDKAPGLSENGSIYTHVHAFFAFGLLSVGMHDEAFKELKKMMPSNTFPDLTTGPLHQWSNFTAGKFHPDYGKNYFSNFTGSCPWYQKCFDHIFGVLADFDGLIIKPAVPSEWGTYRYRKVYQGRTFIFNFERNGSGKTVNSIVVNGVSVELHGNSCRLSMKDFKNRSVNKVKVLF